MMVLLKKNSELQFFFFQNGRHIGLIASLPNSIRSYFLECLDVFSKLSPCHVNIITAI